MRPALLRRCSIRRAPTPALRRRPERQGRGQALQRLSQQRHGQPDRRAGRDLSRPCSASPATTSSARWRGFMSARRRRPRRCCSSTAATFPAFIARYDYAQPMPWLADVGADRARLARRLSRRRCGAAARRGAWRRCRRTGSPASLLSPHPATRIVRSRYPAVTIFAANRDRGPVGRIDASEPEDALITRPGRRRRGPPSAAGRRRLPARADRRTTRSAPPPRRRSRRARRSIIGASIAGMIEAGAFTALDPETAIMTRDRPQRRLSGARRRGLAWWPLPTA